jgi:peroxiredoxin
MSSAEHRRAGPLLALLLLAAGCGETRNDLFPSGADKRPPVVPGTVGPAVGQTAPDFTLPSVAGGTVSLYGALASAPGAVLYFTMWCPICDSHMSDMQTWVIPAWPDVPFFAIDYVSGSVTEAANAQVASGWGTTRFQVLADVGASVEGFYQAPMAVVVVDRNHVVQLNGEYTRERLTAVLGALP